MPTLALRPKHDRRARRGHPWVFANEVERDGLRQVTAGQIVDVVDPKGRFVGRGFADPHAQVVAELVGGKDDDLASVAFWTRRLNEALDHRTIAYGSFEDGRVLDGAGDRTSGVVVDRFDDVAVVRLESLGTRQLREPILEAVREVLGVQAIVLHDGEADPVVVHGAIDELVGIDEGGVALAVPPMADRRRVHSSMHRDNRAALAPRWAGASVLDVYAGVGAWGLAALHHGAERVIAIDKSDVACGALAAVVDTDQLPVQIVCDEAKKTMGLLVDKAHRYDVVILDPPPFAKNKKAVRSALQGYREILELGLTLTHPGGTLVTATRSVHIDDEAFLGELAAAAHKVGRRLRLVHQGGQAADHPVRPEAPELRRVRLWAWSVATDAG